MEPPVYERDPQCLPITFYDPMNCIRGNSAYNTPIDLNRLPVEAFSRIALIERLNSLSQLLVSDICHRYRLDSRLPDEMERQVSPRLTLDIETYQKPLQVIHALLRHIFGESMEIPTELIGQLNDDTLYLWRYLQSVGPMAGF